MIFECSGYAPAMAEMFDLVCPGGKVALVGIPLEPFAFDVSKAQVKEARIENVFRYAHVYPRAVAMLASGKIDVKPLITDRFAFADSVEAFDFAKDDAAGLGQGADRDAAGAKVRGTAREPRQASLPSSATGAKRPVFEDADARFFQWSDSAKADVKSP